MRRWGPAAPRARPAPGPPSSPGGRARSQPRAARLDAATLRPRRDHRNRMALAYTVDAAAPPVKAAADAAPRPRVAGKFLYAGEDKLWVKGVTYGTVRPGDDGSVYPGAAKLRADFTAMAAAGIN